MSDIDVAVIIVTYKSAKLTVDCLRSIETERSTPGIQIRAIVVDNASGDAPHIEKAIGENGWSSWVTLLSASKNGGFAYGNNVGIEHAYRIYPPDYVHLLNPDTIVRAGAIVTLVHFLQTHPDVGIAGSGLEDSAGRHSPIAFRFPSILSELDAGLRFGLVTHLLRPWIVAKHMTAVPQAIDWIPGASMMLRRQVLDTIGGLDENYFLYFEETDFCFRAKLAGFPTWYVPESRVMHITGQSTQVTNCKAKPTRLPGYWFESRRRYFSVTSGVGYAMAVDVVALIAHGLGALKRIALGRSDRGIPHYMRDLARYSPLHRANRKLPGNGARRFQSPT